MRLSPADFWSLSPAEWRCLMAAAAPASGVLTRRELDALCAQYTDERENRK